ncbi:cell division protein FtsA [Bacillus tamaricis]|uniref:Cell division protein FtsA n=1 Tax=Evansella tamaricis TaxID=2069301 RepID=A0ABS6JPE8_9BACI|nr:cell division protein FtsA [Evansella tamaricis]MBU9714682.1 cell division protein FtsA [Evansella tamaricis]
MKNNNDLPIFALDIGTRTVVGLILHKNKEYRVVDIVREEHLERSMLDGQIHNVIAVSSVIKNVKRQLEQSHGPLQKVCVAAAGRSLKTQRARVELNIKGNPIFDQQAVFHLELSAVQQAQFLLSQNNDDNKHKTTDYCVGYSVVEYQIDGEKIGSLVEQHGEIAAVEVIATFLPRIVVESLITALQKADLELEALTLEPIAAIHVLIPPSMRRLNVALVDIGAGTSDIAITNSGTVVAYGMVPVAGDEITEAISDQFLLDFPDAEQLKRDLSLHNNVTLTDILGFETEYSREEVVQQIDSSIDDLAKKISEEILQLNGNYPKAVMLVGGGSMTPKLPEKLASYLNLPPNRVAIRGIDAIQGLTFAQKIESTPELVTPIGIAIAAKESPVQYISILVNEKPVRLFDIKELTIGDGLLTSGLDISTLYGKPGLAKMVKVNGRVVTIPGQHGSAPVIKRNGKLADLSEQISHGDVIEVVSGNDGENGEATIRDLLDDSSSLKIFFNESEYEIEPVLYKNGKLTSPTTLLEDRDTVEIQFPKTIKDVFKQLHVTLTQEEINLLRIYINGVEKVLTTTPQLTLNGQSATSESPVHNGDYIEYSEGKKECYLVKDILGSDLVYETKIEVAFNGEKVQLVKDVVKVLRGEEKLSFSSQIFNGDNLTVIKKEATPFIFQDVFAVVTVERPNTLNKRPLILRNEEETTFSATIEHGDNLALKWVSR